MKDTDKAVCGGKETFLTYAAAEMILKRVRQRKDGTGRLDIYRCPSCRQFHIGSKKKELRSTERRTRKYGNAEMSAM